MARQREFDEVQAVRAMTRTFWTHGYAGTSIHDLEETTGLTAGSLYKAYGSKREIFARCVEHYMREESYLAILLRTDDEPLRDALRTLMDAVIESIEPSAGRAPGCLITNLAAELAWAEPVLGREAARRLTDMQSALLERLRRAKKHGELAARHDPTALSAFLMTVLQGLLVLATTTRDVATMAKTRDFTLRLLDD